MSALRPLQGCSLEMLSNQFFTLPPQCLGGFAIECVRENAFAVEAPRLVIRDDLADVTVLAIASPDLFSRGNNASPDRRGCSLRDRLVLERSLARCRALLIDLIDHRLQMSWVHMPAQFSSDASRMDSGGSNPTVAMPQVERDRKQDSCRLRPAVCHPWVVRSLLEVGVFEIYVGEAVP
jgi:hypothetical protein